MHSSSKKLAGKVALVTGASKGIGAACAKHLAAEGAAVVVNYAGDKAGAEAVAAAITAAGGQAIVAQADLAKTADIDRLLAETHKAFGKLDILVNNAGVYEFLPLDQITPEHFHRHFNVNVLGLLLVTQGAVKLMGDGGSIVNISSGVTTLTVPGSSVYTATKASVDNITRVLSKELGPRKIRVNAINPGIVITEGVKSAGIEGSDFARQVEAQTPLGRVGQPEDIARMVLFLAGPDSDWLTGECILLTGGYR